jgi:hypothetical protein
VIGAGPDGEPSVRAEETAAARTKLRAGRKGKRPMIDRGLEEEVA